MIRTITQCIVYALIAHFARGYSDTFTCGAGVMFLLMCVHIASPWRKDD